MTRISVAVSSHGSPHIGAAIASAAGADEIVVATNGGFTILDPRVRTVDAGASGVIGAVKRAAFRACTGDMVIELDHDDLLMPGAIDRVRAAADAGADFVYSDFAEFHYVSYAPNPYSGFYGWRGYHVTLPIDGADRELIAMRAPDFTAQNIRQILWAPNHLRAWRRSVYDRIGGHDPKRAVCDDHDLLVRTYMAGVRATHIQECLYAYRVHPTQTVQTRNAEIQIATQTIWNENREALAIEHARRAGLRAIDLCGGPVSQPGWESWDLQLGHDLNGPWPAADGSVGVIRADDAIEHLRDPVHTWREIHRVLAQGGFFLSRTPSTDGRGAWQDPTHVSFWNANSFWYVTRAVQQRYVPALVGIRFGVAMIRDYYPTAWHETHRIPYVQADLIRLGGDYQHYGLTEI